MRPERRTVNFRPSTRLILLGLLIASLAVLAAGCGRDDTSTANAGSNTDTGSSATTEDLSGKVEADGSSTVGPLTTRAAELFREEQPNVNVTVGTSGTGGGFERFCAGETDISDASRPIKEDPADKEASVCKEAGIDYTEFQVAIDALTIVVNSENDWATCLTVDQLNKIWEPGSKVNNWNQIDSSFPDERLELAGPGTDSGTFDYFTDEINGEEGASRSDYTASEDDNVIVQAVSGQKGGLGYFGFTYFEENQDTLKALEVDGGEGCVAPSVDTARDGTYAPLSRPLFVYVKNESLTRPEIQGFLRFYFENLTQIAEEAQFIPLPDEDAQKAVDDLETAIGAAGA
jgi:phosphate transport system substrate-binding protein